MRKGRSVLVVVPARGGSKGIPLKNLRQVKGLSLVGYAGRVACSLGYGDRLVVSTDNDAIASEAERHGLSAPFRRSVELSGDAVGDWQVLDEALRTMERVDSREYDVVVMLQPTCPLRTPEMVTRTVDFLVEGRFDSVWTVSRTDPKNHPLKQLLIRDGVRSYFDAAGANVVARQQLEPLYHRNGAAYAMTRDCILRHGDIDGEKTGAVVVDEPLANIDEEIDLTWAEFLADRC